VRRGDLITPRQGCRDLLGNEAGPLVWTKLPRGGKSHRVTSDEVGIVVRHTGQHTRALIGGRVWSIVEGDWVVVA